MQSVLSVKNAGIIETPMPKQTVTTQPSGEEAGQEGNIGAGTSIEALLFVGWWDEFVCCI